MVLKKKKGKMDNKDQELKDGEGEVKKKVKKPAEGSRYAALILLVVTVLISVGFYIYGLWSSRGVEIEVDFGEVNNTWEYEK